MNERLNEESNLFNKPEETPKKDEGNLTIKIEEDILRVNFSHELIQTHGQVQHMLDYYQFRFSQRASRLVPREEITISPAEGEAVPVATSFLVRLGKPLYVGLNLIHIENPSVLPKLVNDLEKYQKDNILEDTQEQLIRHTINGLKEIIEPKRK